ncbi:MAG TPA: carboxypeptidase-like regulatory domain-containing protein [Terriglobales bacterium]|nr:carboxypeptidase-like regulatory domain-containing protein [Terriglobales bacterium]
MRIAKLISLFVLAGLLSAYVCAQTGTTSLRGTITDPNGAVIPGATVTLLNPQTGYSRTVKTTAQGEYQFLEVPPATYTVIADAAGFAKYKQDFVALLVNTPSRLDLSMQVAGTSTTVEVTGAAPLVNTTDASLGAAFSEQQVKQLPLEGRNIPDLLTLEAGVVYTGNRSDINKDLDTRSGAVNGSRSDQSNITLDGVDVNDQVNGYAFTSVLPVTGDSLQEFRTTTTNYGADQGRSSGAQVSLVTKSGTNSFHGSLYEYHRNTATSANDFFVKQAELASGQSNTPPKLIRNIFGGSLGGPILKNRLFFFANYEGSRQREENSVLRIVPSDSLRDGVTIYQCQDASQCPATMVKGVSGTAHPVPAGYYGLTPSQLAAMDPLPTHVGPNPVMLQYFNTFPHTNDVSAGDGFNFVGYRFRGPVPTNNNWYIARVDYKITQNGNHSLFWRGAMRNDVHSDVPYLDKGGPAGSQIPLHTNADYSKGFSLGYTAVFRPTLINNFHWGFTRQSIGVLGNNDSQPFIYFRGLNDDEGSNNSELAVTRSRTYQTPVHNFVDDISWNRGKHTFQFGGDVRFIRNPKQNFLNSFSDGFTNSSGLDTAGIANKTSPLDPGHNGLPAVNTNFNLNYNWPVIALMGIVTQLDAQYNYTKTGAVLPQGAPVTRRFAADEFEFYAQDAFRVKPNLTITYGLRYSLFSPPWETNGTQVAPSTSLGRWYQTRGQDMNAGIAPNLPPISFSLAGPANGTKGYYNWDYHNFAPRLAFAYSPRPSWNWLKSLVGDNDKTSIRAGFGMVYDRIGAGLLNTFDRYGSFGLSTNLTNSTVPSVASAPRVTDLNTVPVNDQSGNRLLPAAPPGGFPYTPPNSGGGLGIYWGLDDLIRTPYSYTIDFSISRQLPKNMLLNVSYVGRFAHRLLSQEDLAMPLNLVDKKTGITYFEAASRISQMAAAGVTPSQIASNPGMLGPTAAYWKDIISPLKPGDSYSTPGCGPNSTNAAVAAFVLFSCNLFNETTPLSQLDFLGSDFSGTPGIAGALTDSQGVPLNYYPSVFGANTFFDPQFHSLYAWRSIGNANYNALQVNLRKAMSQGLQFDFNYTFSKSIDLSSDAERITEWGGLGGQVINSWQPDQLRAVSDFDARHQFNMNWIWQMPFGKGRLLARDAGGVLDAIIGGWQLSGLARWTSGFPVSIANGGTWPTNWQLGGAAMQIAPAHTGVTENADGSVNLFPDPTGASGIQAFRHDFPGESGMRNTLRGPGYAGLDAGLDKTWKMPYNEAHSVQFRWEVFNVLNLTRFDVQSITNAIDQSSAFGKFSGLLTNPRVMQFALRYDF